VLVLEDSVHACQEALSVRKLSFFDDPRRPHLVLQLFFCFLCVLLVALQVSEKLKELV
jgi:hypothetical protein